MKLGNCREDLLSGFLVFLIALPLCLGIAAASGFPPVAGIITAIIGGLVCSPLGSSPLTIKGPAAGLIVIVLAAVQELGGGDKMIGYRKTLAAGVLAASIQIILSFMKGATFTQIIPLSVIHGMLSAIGAIIIIKQIPVLLGAVGFKASFLGLLTGVPDLIKSATFDEAIIGVFSLIVMFGFGFVARGKLKKIPAQIIVLVLGVVLAAMEHLNPFIKPELTQFFVTVPDQTFQLITLPDFSSVFSLVSIKHSVFLCLVASIESLLTVNAVDSLDKEKRISDLNRDLFSAGLGNLISSMLGGLPMISEIVRSRANIDNGAKGAASNFFHGVFLLLAVLLLPHVLDRIPLACLAAMLIYTGTRLASIQEFKHAYESGRVHFISFMLTLCVTVGTDLLTGVFAGFLFELVCSFWMAKKKLAAFSAKMNIEGGDERVVLKISDSINFINFIWISSKVEKYLKEKAHISIDLSQVSHIDSTSSEKLSRLCNKFTTVQLVGYEKERL